jgi:hypothetical protein
MRGWQNGLLKRDVKMAKCIAMMAMVVATMVLASAPWAQSSGTGGGDSSGTSSSGGHHHHQKSWSTSQESK